MFTLIITIITLALVTAVLGWALWRSAGVVRKHRDNWAWLHANFGGNEHWLNHEFPNVARYAQCLSHCIKSESGFGIANFREELRSMQRRTA